MAIFGNTGVGIDLGSSVTSIYLSDEEKVVLREPTCVLVSAENGQDVLAVGSQAHSLSGRTAEDTDLVKPIERGCVADVELTALLMVAQCEKAMGRKKPLEKATLLCSLPGGASRVSRSALFQAMTATGAKKIASLRTPVAAALGAGLDISAPRGVLEICLGGGLTELAVLSMNGIAAMRSLPFGGETMDEDIVRWFWREKGVLIGMRTAEQLKRELGTVLPEDEDDRPAGQRGDLLAGREKGAGGIGGAGDRRDEERAVQHPARAVERPAGDRHTAFRRRGAADRPEGAAGARGGRAGARERASPARRNTGPGRGGLRRAADDAA